MYLPSRVLTEEFWRINVSFNQRAVNELAHPGVLESLVGHERRNLQEPSSQVRPTSGSRLVARLEIVPTVDQL